MKNPLPGAGLARRLACLLYELLLVGALLLVASALITPLLNWLGPSLFATLLSQLYFAAVLFAYFGWCWVRGGQTVAMKTWRIRLVDRAGLTLSWRGAFRRYVFALGLYVGLPALSYLGLARSGGSVLQHVALALVWWLLPLLSAWLDPEKLFLHDRLAGTRLVEVPKKAKS
ncbi:RDD family protein [Crenobacter cavernae]|uniref:RDD family protein n=1 Tax=Crenobacter cavernae TaxID=2290923 RepID=A0A345Y5D4_9NEIS|nr:RDD family protein [Crenobacter cavernae]AXK39136.1 RDD family protein [Crenobacter cavernae]